MPRVAQQSTTLNAKNPLIANQPSVLKRNQACHQCRRRKLKCDANLPCSTCVRSHAYALSHAAPGMELLPNPECTFDESKPDLLNSERLTNLVAETPPSSSENKYQRLKDKISELEALLRKKENDKDTTGTTLGWSGHTLNPPTSKTISSRPTSGSGIRTHENLNIASDTRLYLIRPEWPSSLPSPELLHHLIGVFLTFHPHAKRLLHIPTFMQSLALSPTHPKFPALPLLHAICAIGSLYSSAVTSPLPLDLDEVPADQLFLGRIRWKGQRPVSFAEIHANLAKELADRCHASGDNLLQVLQANVILTWFYWSHSNWVSAQSFFSSAHSLHLAVLLGLNISRPSNALAKIDKPLSILPPPRTVIEDEMRRNTFWLAYTTDRQYGMGHGWTLSLDDQDVSQLLPVGSKQFMNGTFVTSSERQWNQSPEILLVHPETQIDSFILYIKGCILISKVKFFILHRTKYSADESSATLVYNRQDSPTDPRSSPIFIELDHVATTFIGSFPPHLRNPINENVVDSHLYTACLMPHVATIALHDPHAEMGQVGCLSAQKLLFAARAISDLIHAMKSTSYDTTLLDTFCIFCWFTCGRVLARFLSTAVAAKSTGEVSKLRSEVEYVHAAIAKVGERVLLASCYARMLKNSFIECCGSGP